MAEVEVVHAWDVRIFADNHRWTFRAVCSCGWQGQAFRQEMRGKTLENRTVPRNWAGAEGLAHARGCREL